MDTQELRCEERIDGHLQALEQDIKAIVDGYENGGDEGMDAWNEYPLAISSRLVTKIELSWGGPSDFLSVEHDENHIYSVVYHFQDWYDGAKREVSQDSQVWRYASSVIEAQRL